MTPEEKEGLAALKQKLAVRKDKPGWAENVKAIEARIREIESGA